MNESLFRPEVNLNQKVRLNGSVIISQSPFTVFTAYLILALIFLVSIWLFNSHFSSVETVRGVVVTNPPPVKILAGTPGIIEIISKVEGDKVKQGDRLAIIQSERRTSEGRLSVGAVLASLDRRIQIAKDQARSEAERFEFERLKLRASLVGNKKSQESIKEQIYLQNQILEAQDNELHRIATIVKKGFISATDLQRRMQQLIITKQNLLTLRNQYDELVSQESQAVVGISSLRAQSSSQNNTILSNISEMEGERDRLYADTRYAIFSPASGTITAIQSANGDAVGNGTLLMTIVPNTSSFQVNVYVPSRSIGAVRVGTRASLQYDAFPFQKYGNFKGHVVNISKTTIDPRESGSPIESTEPVYRITIKIEQDNKLDRDLYNRLKSGMTVTANLITENRSFIDLLVAPLRRYTSSKSDVG